MLKADGCVWRNTAGRKKGRGSVHVRAGSSGPGAGNKIKILKKCMKLNKQILKKCMKQNKKILKKCIKQNKKILKKCMKWDK